MTLAVDIETDRLVNPTRVWCVCVQDVDTGETDEFHEPDINDEERERLHAKLEGRVQVYHNGISFDVPVMRSLLECRIPDQVVVDTLVMSRLDFFDRPGGNSLEAWGDRFGYPKGDFKDFEGGLTDEMLVYCRRDVEITVKVYHHLKGMFKDQKEALRCEHDIQWLCNEMTENGFLFDVDKAEGMLKEVKRDMGFLEAVFQRAFPPKLHEVNRIKYRVKKDGELFANVEKAMLEYPKTEVDKEELVCYDYKYFNPGSPVQRIDRLWEAGWKPFEKTKGHLKFEREQQQRQWGRR